MALTMKPNSECDPTILKSTQSAENYLNHLLERSLSILENEGEYALREFLFPTVRGYRRKRKGITHRDFERILRLLRRTQEDRKRIVNKREV